MKLLFDQNISYRIIQRIKDIFPDSQQVRNLRLENSTTNSIEKIIRDNEILIKEFLENHDYKEISCLEIE